MSNRTAYDITDGFKDDTFAGLSERDRDAIVTLLARASERAYRRGFQQGHTIGKYRPADIRKDLHAWRYGRSADDAPWADAPRIETSADRLFVENGELRRLGLTVPIADAIIPELRSDPSYRPKG